MQSSVARVACTQPVLQRTAVYSAKLRVVASIGSSQILHHHSSLHSPSLASNTIISFLLSCVLTDFVFLLRLFLILQLKATYVFFLHYFFIYVLRDT